MKKGVLALVLVLTFSMGLTSGLVFAADSSDNLSGTCGDNLTWVLEDGVLTISGTGEMDDYSYEEDAPWHDLNDEISSIIIEEGVTSVGNSAFSFCSNLESVSLPITLTSIGSKAFFSCKNLVNIEIPASITSIGHEAFGIVIDELTTDDDLAEEGIEFEVIVRSVIFEGDAPELVSEYDSIAGAETYHIFGTVFYAYGGEGIPSYDDYSGQYPDVTIYYYSDAEGFTDEYKALLEECANVTWIVLDRGNDETESAGSADTGSTDTESDSSDGTDSDSADGSVLSGDSDTSLSVIDSETTASYTLGSGSGATIAVDADIDTFVSVTVDGIVLTQDTDYTVTEGSTIITFTESFLETLSEGDHEVIIAFVDGAVETTLSIAAASEDASDSDDADDSDDSSAAEVGDSSGLGLWMALGLFAALGLAGAGLRKKTN